MRFEFLPNEILIECIEYLNPFEIFYSFDRLNYRFYNLIRNTRLHVNFQHVRKSTFDQFCEKMLLNPELKRQIYSLDLSNDYTCGQIKAFLSFFALNEFPHLQSLTLTEIKQDDMEKLKSTLSLIYNLRKLSFQGLYNILIHINKTLSITSLTVDHCSFAQLFQISKYMPLLKYLNIQMFVELDPTYDEPCVINCAVYLKQLIIRRFRHEFEKLEMFLKQIPNLKSLTMEEGSLPELMDACRWEHLIRSSLPYLNIFKFYFTTYDANEKSTYVEKFKQFQSDFWCKEHYWHTEYSLSNNEVSIYTIPYVPNYYKLYPCTSRYSNSVKSNFNNVTDLDLYHQALTETCQYEFSNVTSLEVFKLVWNDNSFLTPENIQSLKMIVNLSNLKHLDISSCSSMDMTEFLLEISQGSPQLSSISIQLRQLILFLNNDNLCKYMNPRIKKFKLFDSYYHSTLKFDYSNGLEKFCEIFSNVEQLECTLDEPKFLFLLLNKLTKLSSVNASVRSSLDRESAFSWFNNEFKKLNVMYDLYNDPPYDKYTTSMNIWLGEPMDSS